jgi:dihydroorotate dehydrogenase electron transfer subunit
MQSVNTRVSACIGAGTAHDVLLLDAFEAAGISVKVSTEDGSIGTKGLLTELVGTIILNNKPDWLYACGPTGMLAALSRLCRTHTLSHQLSWEAHIRCGLGICGSCEGTDLRPWVPPGWLVCQDGPVQIVEYTQ